MYIYIMLENYLLAFHRPAQNTLWICSSPWFFFLATGMMLREIPEMHRFGGSVWRDSTV